MFILNVHVEHGLIRYIVKWNDVTLQHYFGFHFKTPYIIIGKASTDRRYKDSRLVKRSAYQILNNMQKSII